MKYKKLYLLRYFLLTKNVEQNITWEVLIFFLRRVFVAMKNHLIHNDK